MTSDNFKKESVKSVSDVVMITLAEFTHPSLTVPARVTDNNEAVTHKGNKFTPFPMKIELPKESKDTSYVGTIMLSNIGRELVDTFLSVRHGIECKLIVVCSNSLDFAEIQVKMKVQSVEIDQNFINLRLEDGRDKDETFIKALGRSDLLGI